MFHSIFSKTLLAAGALAGLAFIATPSPTEAASRAYCDAYARDVANDYAPRRGLIGGVVALPFDVAGAVLTGRTTYDGRWDRAYNAAYSDCRAGGTVVITEPDGRAFAVDPEIMVEECPDTGRALKADDDMC